MLFRRSFLFRFLAAVAAGLLLSSCNDGGGDDSGGGGGDTGDNDKNTVVCLGDSITEGRCAGAGAPYPNRLADLSGKNVINAGSCGEKSSGAASRAGGLLAKYKPGYMCILTGANDAIFGFSVGEVEGNIRTIIQACKANKTIPLVGTVLPMYDTHAYGEPEAAAYSEMIRKVAKEEGAKLVDLRKEFGSDRGLLQADGLHPSDAGTQLIALSFNDRL